MTKVSWPSNNFFNQRTVMEPSSETLLPLAKLVLMLICFSFGGNYYKHTHTTHNSSIRSDKGLTLETSALKLFTVANLRNQLSW